MDTSNLVTRLQTLSAKHALTLSTQGSEQQRLSMLSLAGVVPGVLVHDSVTGQEVEVVSTGVVYLGEEQINAV